MDCTDSNLFFEQFVVEDRRFIVGELDTMGVVDKSEIISLTLLGLFVQN